MQTPALHRFKPFSACRVHCCDRMKTRAECINRDEDGTYKATRRAAVLSLGSFTLMSSGVNAKPLELAQIADGEGYFGDMRKKARELSDKNDEAFENSDFLKGLREKTTANKARYRKELQDRYCYRQAELGVGDCGGLSLIPGATKSGKQKTPEWLNGVLQKLGQSPPDKPN